MHKTCTGIKKTQETKVWASTQGWGCIDCKLLFFLVFLMPVQVLWRSCFVFFVFFDACACLVKVRVTKSAQASKKTKTNKPLDAQNLHRHLKKNKVWASTQGWGSIDCKLLFFLVVLMPVQVLWRSCFGFFSFFDACACFVKFCRD